MVYDYYKEAQKRAAKFNFSKGKYILAAAIFLVIIALVIASGIYLKIIQLDEIGNLSSIYIKNLQYMLIFAAASFVVIFAVITLSNHFIIRNMKVYFKENDITSRKMPNYLIALVLGIIGAFLCKEYFYQNALNFLNASKFGVNAPMFNLDIGYFVFQRPFLMSVYQFFSTLWVLIIVYTAAYYVLIFLVTYSNNLTWEDLKVKSIIRHNLINIAIYFIIKTLSYKFQKEGLLYSSFYDVKGAGYIDVNIWMNYFKIIPFVLVAIVIVSFIFIWRGKLKSAAITIATYPVIWILVMLTATVIQNLIVLPNEQSFEKEYLKYNMQDTRQAYGIDNIKSYVFPKMKDLTPAIINRNQDTKNNIRIVDYQATLDSDIQLQSNTNFYTFNNGDIVNYNINGKDEPVFITARETDKNKIPQKDYINTTFKYTHGYGIVINPINKLTPQGQVDFVLSGLKMDNAEGLTVTEPRIYYGELTDDSVIVNPKNTGGIKEINYDGSPETEKNYTGIGGIDLTPLNRILFAIKNGDLNMLISRYVSSDSRLLLNRQVVTRAQMAVPFLTIDSDPYILLDKDGRLKWVLDAYTTTDFYPYSQDYQGFNYIRNSVKVVIDAYDGKVKYYIVDKKDPLIETYKMIYPGIFSEEAFPADLASHMKYPEELFKIQTEILKRYHLNPADDNNISMFFTNQDLWNIAKYPDQTTTDSVIDIEPYYNMIKLPGITGAKEELILMRPFTPSGEKHNMISWLAVRNNYLNNGADYGQLILYTFPKNYNILGPDQVEVNINQISEISEYMTLWNQSGSTVFKGSLLVIPIEDSVLYVEPIYIRSASKSSIPQVRKIVVGYQTGNDFKHGLGNNLDEALANLFAGINQSNDLPGIITPVPTIAGTTPTANQQIINDIQSKYSEIQKQLDALGKLIEGLKK